MEGAKAYILPAIAALLLLAYFIFRPSVDTGTGTPNTAAGSSLASEIDAAVRAERVRAGLDEAYAASTREVIAAAVTQCRGDMKSDSGVVVEVGVNAAVALGGHFTTVALKVHPPGGLERVLLCVRESLGSAVLPVPGRTQTGTFAATFYLQ